MLLSLVSTPSSCIPHSNLRHHISTTLKWRKCFCHQIRGPKGREKVEEEGISVGVAELNIYWEIRAPG